MENRKRRALVLTQEISGHPFRRSLPAHVFKVQCDDAGEADANALAAKAWKLSGGDWRQFLTAYCAAFVVIFTFIL